MDLWMKVMKKRQIDPNFWCSSEYLKFQGAESKSHLGWIWIESEGQMWFPPIHVFHGIDINHPWLGYEQIWSDFHEFRSLTGKSEFLDYEFIYDPNMFRELKGSQWKKFRKNIRKWPSRQSYIYSYQQIGKCDKSLEKSINEMIIDWLDSRGEDKFIHDAEALLHYMRNTDHRAALICSERGVMGINAWDESWKYLNYRFMICRPEPFLDEYMRYLFYTSDVVISSDKMINDGGVLDREGLKRFKESLNPIRIRKVHSWKRFI